MVRISRKLSDNDLTGSNELCESRIMNITQCFSVQSLRDSVYLKK